MKPLAGAAALSVAAIFIALSADPAIGSGVVGTGTPGTKRVSLDPPPRLGA